MVKSYQVIVKGLKGETVLIDVSDSEEGFKRTTVGQLKEKIVKRFCLGAGPEDIRLIQLDKLLDNDCKLLSEYGVEDKSVLFLMMTLPRGLTA